jgi:hypothetical protein
MSHQRFLLGVFVVALVALAGLGPAQAQEEKKMRPPIWSRLAKATIVVIGEVGTIEDKTVEAVSDPSSKEKRTYQVAHIKVTDVILGPKDLKEVKVGFYKEGELKPEQTAVFIVGPHFAQPFNVFADIEQDLFFTDHRYFELRTKILRHAAQCLAEPNEMLKSQEPRDRLLAASVLISRYRDSSVGKKEEPIDAEQSKLLLRALRDADWGKEDKSFRLKPQPIFEMLGLTAKDGWNAPKKPEDARSAAEDWLIDNHAKYRIQRFVPDNPPK